MGWVGTDLSSPSSFAIRGGGLDKSVPTERVLPLMDRTKCSPALSKLPFARRVEKQSVPHQADSEH